MLGTHTCTSVYGSKFHNLFCFAAHHELVAHSSTAATAKNGITQQENDRICPLLLAAAAWLLEDRPFENAFEIPWRVVVDISLMLWYSVGSYTWQRKPVQQGKGKSLSGTVV